MLGPQLKDAADQISRRGRELILLVGGLDEDTGAWGLNSVASLLPRFLNDGIRIVFSSRRDAPLPRDVSAGHPLWASPVRPLVASDHVRKLEERAREEIEWMVSSHRFPEPLHPGRQTSACCQRQEAASHSGTWPS